MKHLSALAQVTLLMQVFCSAFQQTQFCFHRRVQHVISINRYFRRHLHAMALKSSDDQLCLVVCACLISVYEILVCMLPLKSV